MWVRSHSRSLKMVPFDRPYDFLLVRHCNYKVPHSQGDHAWITQCYLQLLQCLPLPRKRLPDDASLNWGCGHLTSTSASWTQWLPHFWRATLCIANPMRLCAVCPSVCSSSTRLSVTFVYWIERSKRIIELFHRLAASPFQFVHTRRHIAIFGRGPFDGGVECRWGMKKIAIFNKYLALSRKLYKIGHGYCRTPIGTGVHSFDWCYLQWLWVTPPLHDIVLRQTALKHDARPIVTRADWQQVVYDLSTSATFNDL